MCRHAHIGQYNTEAGISTQTSTITVSTTSVRHLHAQFTRPFMGRLQHQHHFGPDIGHVEGHGRIFLYFHIHELVS
jgi:hypothetical protein